MIYEDQSQLAEARSGMYKFLASIFLERPGLEFVVHLLSGDLQKSLAANAPPDEVSSDFQEGLKAIEGFVDEHRSQPREQLHLDIAAEWTRLFRGIRSGYGPPPPYESVYEGGGLMGVSAVNASAVYAKVNVAVSKDLGEGSDYIGVELDFMRLLCGMEAEAWRRNDFKAAVEKLKLEQDFLNNHPAKWFPRFCSRVLNEAGLGVFKGLVLVTNSLISWDRGNIASILQTASC